MKLNESLNEFIQNKDMHCFLLTGPWGSGKTYAVDEWKKSVEEDKNNIFIPISLFGVSDVNQLNSLALSSSSMANKFVDYIKSLDQNVSVGVGNINVSLPLIGMVANLLKKDYPHNKNKKYIFVIDDIERRDNKLSVEEIFGFVDQLPKANTKVILITNTCPEPVNKRKNNKTFKSFKEKIVQKEYAITKPSIESIKAVAGEELYNIIGENTPFLTNLRTIIRLKNILSSIDSKKISGPIVECMFFCVAFDNIEDQIREKLKEIYCNEEKMASVFVNGGNGAGVSEKEIAEKVEERINRIATNAELLYEFIVGADLILDIPRDILKQIVLDVFNIISNTEYDRLTDICIPSNKKTKKIGFSSNDVFYSQCPTKEYEKRMSEIDYMFGDRQYDQVEVYKTYVSMRLIGEKYVNKKSSSLDLATRLETKCINPVSDALVEGDYGTQFDILLRFGTVPKNIVSMDNNIRVAYAKKVSKKLLKKATDGKLSIKELDAELMKAEETVGHNASEQIEIDSIMKTVVVKMYNKLFGDISTVWEEAHRVASWISNHKEQYSLTKTIEYIGSHLHCKNIQSKRLFILNKQYSLYNSDD